MIQYEHPKKMLYIRSVLIVYIRAWRRSPSTSNRAFILGAYVAMCGIFGIDGFDYAHTYDQLIRIIGEN